MVVKGAVIGAVGVGGSILATLAYCLWAEKRYVSKPGTFRGSTPPPVPPSTVPDDEETYDHELALVGRSLSKSDSLEFGRYFDALGSLMVSCPSDDVARRLSDIALIGIVSRNRIWGLSERVPYTAAVAGLVWAEQEMRRVIEEAAASVEWLKAGLRITNEFFVLLRKVPPQTQIA